MFTLYELCFNKIVKNKAFINALKRLPLDLRSKINAVWFNSSVPQHYWLDGLRMRCLAEYTGYGDEKYFSPWWSSQKPARLGYQDNDCISYFYYKLPTVYEDRDSVKLRGFYYHPDHVKSHMTILAVSYVKINCIVGGQQMRVMAFPKKSQLRRLQALILPLIVPFVSLKEDKMVAVGAELEK